MVITAAHPLLSIIYLQGAYFIAKFKSAIVDDHWYTKLKLVIDFLFASKSLHASPVIASNWAIMYWDFDQKLGIIIY